MNIKVFLTTFMLLYSFMAIGQGAAPTVNDILDNEDTGGRGKIREDTLADDTTNSQTTMEKISEKFVEVNKAYKACKSDSPPNTESKVEDCMWKEMVAQGKDKEILQYLEDEKEAHKENPSLKTGAQGNFRTTKDQTTRKLEEFLKERLNKILFDEDKEGVKVLSNHAQYYEIYKSQIGQNIIRIASDICIYAKSEQEVISPGVPKLNEDGSPTFTGKIPAGESDRQKNKKNNLKNLSVSLNGQPKSFWVYSACLTSMASQCKEGGYMKTCNVLKYMEEAKRGIQDIDGIKKEFEDYGSSASIEGIDSGENTDDKELAKATLISSGEIDDAELSDTSTEEAKILKRCTEEGDLKPTEECKQYLTDQDDKEVIEAEFMIRQKAIEERIKEKIAQGKTDDSKKVEIVTAILKEEGLSDEQIKQYLAKEEPGKFDPLEDIQKRYTNERKAIIEELTSRNFDKTGTNSTDTNKSSFQELETAAANKTDDLKESIHFFNVVGAFIDITNSEGESFKNTNALKNELENSGFSDTSGSTSFDGDHTRNLNEMLSNTKNQAKEEDPPTLDAKNIDDLVHELSDNDLTN